AGGVAGNKLAEMRAQFPVEEAFVNIERAPCCTEIDFAFTGRHAQQHTFMAHPHLLNTSKKRNAVALKLIQAPGDSYGQPACPAPGGVNIRFYGSEIPLRKPGMQKQRVAG